jgi:ribosomal protein S18 acetylase RimI-like enzyme
VEVRRARPDELALVRQLWEEFEHEVPDPVGKQPVWSDVAEDAEAAIADGCVLLAIVDDQAAAFSWATPPERGVARLEYLHVTCAHRREGIARRLVHVVADDMAARGATDLVLEVVTTNDIGVATWNAHGFDVIEYRLASPITTLTAQRHSMDA